MKKGFLFLLIIIVLAACSNDGEKIVVEKEDSQPKDSSNVAQQESDSALDDEKETTKGKEKELTKEKNNTVAPGENLLKEDIVFEYEDGDIVMTIDLAEFTREFTTSTGEDTRDETLDSKILLHLKGTISNDTVNSFSYGNQLGKIRFKVIYDDKHEFDFYATSESLDGSKFEGSSIDPLQEQVIHMYSAVPLPVSERDNSLVLIITDKDGEHEIVLR